MNIEQFKACILEQFKDPLSPFNTMHHSGLTDGKTNKIFTTLGGFRYFVSEFDLTLEFRRYDLEDLDDPNPYGRFNLVFIKGSQGNIVDLTKMNNTSHVVYEERIQFSRNEIIFNLNRFKVEIKDYVFSKVEDLEYNIPSVTFKMDKLHFVESEDERGGFIENCERIHRYAESRQGISYIHYFPTFALAKEQINKMNIYAKYKNKLISLFARPLRPHKGFGLAAYLMRFEMALDKLNQTKWV